MTMLSVISVVFALGALAACSAQTQQRAGGGGGQRLRGPKKQPAQLAMPNHFQALTINYPLDLFVSDSKDWRSHRAVYDPALVRESENDKPYVDIARAQDQEDVWLYENYFYGMKDGIIMESGALNGILFSTSFMFEHFANWTAIHVGRYCHCRAAVKSCVCSVLVGAENKGSSGDLGRGRFFLKSICCCFVSNRPTPTLFPLPKHHLQQMQQHRGGPGKLRPLEGEQRALYKRARRSV
jgi:hypothetical protein